MFCDGFVTASMPSLSGRPPHAPVIMSTITNGLAVRGLPADGEHGVAALARRGHAVGQGLGQRAQHHVEHPIAGQRARRARARQARVQDAALGRDHVDAAEHARVVGHVLPEHRADREVGARLGERERGVERGLHLGRAARPVAGEVSVGVHGDRHRERHRLVAEPVAVEVVGEAVGAPRPAGDLGAGETLRVVEQLRGVAPRLVARRSGRRAAPARARPPCRPRTAAPRSPSTRSGTRTFFSMMRRTERLIVPPS